MSQTIKSALQTMRPKQWAKNVFVLASFPYLIQAGDLEHVHRLLLLFLSFCFSASSVYVINDLADRERDKLHPKKRFRAIPSGAVSFKTAVGIAIALIAGSILSTIPLGIEATICILSYHALSHLYTFFFKHVAPWDVVFVGFLYSIRVLASFLAVSIYPSGWVLWVVLAGLIACILELGKRKSEVRALGANAPTRKTLHYYSIANLEKHFAQLRFPTVAVYGVAAVLLAPLFGASVALAFVGVNKFWGAIDRATEDIHPQQVIFEDKSILAIVAIFAVLFAAAVIKPISLT